MAYRLFLDGKHQAKIRPEKRDSLVPTGVLDEEGKPIFISYRQIPLYVNEQFYQAYSWYVQTKLLAPYPPYPGGWMDWPEVAVVVLRAFNLEQNRMEQEQLEINDRRKA